MSALVLRQNAYVTEMEDLDSTMRYWTGAYGAGPWYMSDVDLHEATFRGDPARTQCRVALTMFGSGQIEIIAPSGAESRVFREWLDERGPAPPGGLFHHFRIDTDDFEGLYARLLATGATEGLRAKAPGNRDVAYLDGTSTVGSYIEIFTQTEDTVRVMDAMRYVCERWDGSEPIRDYASFVADVAGGSGAKRRPTG